MRPTNLNWQSRLVLGLVVTPVAVGLVFQIRFWAANQIHVTLFALLASLLLGLAAFVSRSATRGAALTGALLTASMIFSTTFFPYHPWQTAIVPILAVLVLTSFATRFGRSRKEKLGMAEEKHGRNAAQVCANLGFASLACSPTAALLITDSSSLVGSQHDFATILALAAYAALAEAAADTVSSEIGQVLGGRPFLLTSFRRVEPGTDGAISLAGTLAGVLAAGIIAAIGAFTLNLPWTNGSLIWAGGVFGLFFDSLLGATIERKGWLNNDAVNFLSTASAALAVLLFLINNLTI